MGKLVRGWMRPALSRPAEQPCVTGRIHAAGMLCAVCRTDFLPHPKTMVPEKFSIQHFFQPRAP